MFIFDSSKGTKLKLLEYEAKEIFRKFGILTPEGCLATEMIDVQRFAKNLGKPVVVKAQLPVGGRGKAGGIKFADTPSEALDAANELLGLKVKDLRITKLLVEEKICITREVFLGITIDRYSKQYVLLASKDGGVDIENVASDTPEKIVKLLIDPIIGLRDYHIYFVGKKLGYSGKKLSQFGDVMRKLYELVLKMDAELTEINPLVEVEDGFIAVDAKLNIDNNALFRHKEIDDKLSSSYHGEFTEKEIEAKTKGLTYVELDGDIGIVGNGAGLTMASLDTVMLYGGKAANFLDLGGGATAERISMAVDFVLRDEKTKVLFVNVLGGMTRGDYIALGIVESLKRLGVEKPIVVRLTGTNEEEGRLILEEAGIEMMGSMEEAARKAVQLAGGI
jgi:succinyl-CoA synthetase beta subunit